MKSKTVFGRMPFNFARLFPLLLSAAFIAGGGCSKRNADGVIDVAESDAEMNAAIEKARASLPKFWQAFERPAPGEKDFALKVRIKDKEHTEHFWANDLQRKDGKILGTINNDAELVKRVKLGDRIEIPEADISDWTYMRDGKIVGNATMRALFKQMPAKEVEAYKKMMAEE